MGLITAMQRPKREQRRWDPLDDRWYGETGITSASGETVTPETSLENSAVFLAIGLVAGTMGSLPLKLMRQTGSTREPAREHPLFDVLHRNPNPWQTAFEWREMLQGHILTRGNAYNEIVKSRGGVVRELVPLNPALMRIEVNDTNRRLVYVYDKKPGVPKRYRQEQILHLHGLSSNGISGLSPVTLARETLGLNKAQEKQASTWMGNRATPSGTLTTPETLSKEQRENLKKSWKTAYGGDNLGSTAVLENGLVWQAIGFDAENLQFLESRVFQITEVCRWFNVPPNKLYEWSRSHFDNVEQANLSFVVDSIRPWAERWEQRLDKSLLSDRERAEGYFFKFSLEGLLRGDSAARAAFYKQLFEVASITSNEIRQTEDMNPMEGGDQLFVPLNLVPLQLSAELALSRATQPEPAEEEDDDDPEPTPEPDEEPRQVFGTEVSLSLRRQYQISYQRMMEAEAQKIVKKEHAEIVRASKQENTLKRLEGFYERFEGEIADRLTPLMVAYCELVTASATEEVRGIESRWEDDRTYAEDYSKGLAKRYVEKSLSQIRKLVTNGKSVQERAEEWVETRAKKLSRAETVRAGGAFARRAYHSNGANTVRWHSFGDGCELDGAVTSGVFVERGAKIGDKRVLRDIRHPGLHRDCDCLVAATEAA